MDRPDAQLIGLSRQGDREAFAGLVTRYQQKVFTVALRLLQDREEARDVTQEAFIRAYRNLSRFHTGAAFSPWICAIAVNLARDCWRRRQREPGPFPGDDGDGSLPDVPDDRYSPEKIWAAKEKRQAVQRAVAALPWDYRVTVTLRHFQNMSYEEIARSLGLPLNTVKTRLRRGRLMLQKELAPWLAGEEGNG
ncbi:RNA polymerase sigma factor [Desulfotomaculum copahuensis]|uniref:RNA polymerase sigma factor n=1 Tax=Desulfotomaculum copahuensis TaxID=1838280 RepID=UPI001372C4BF|nr:sigma-70 family RNA polymerase sigma factor [Desulfotomaculum copahuensis]